MAEEISELMQLNKLNLSHNRLQQLPEGLYKLDKLGELQLSHNKIEEISRNVGYLSNLQTLVSTPRLNLFLMIEGSINDFVFNVTL